MAFMGRDYVSYIEVQLREVVAKATAAGASLDQLFLHFDVNGDGDITTAEFGTALRQLPGFETITADDVDALCKRFDGDDDGNVSLAAFMKFMGEDGYKAGDAMQKMQKVLRKLVEKGGWEALRTKFSERDADNDGKLTHAEAEVALRTLRGSNGGEFSALTRDEVAEIVRRLDADGSGTISLDEFEAFALKGGALADDGNGEGGGGEGEGKNLTPDGNGGEAESSGGDDSAQEKLLEKEAKMLRVVLRKAESVGASLEQIFAKVEVP